MSNADVPSLALKDIVANPVNPWTGAPVNMERKKEPLYISPSAGIDRKDKNATTVILNPERDFYVHDNIFDAANWKSAADKSAGAGIQESK